MLEAKNIEKQISVKKIDSETLNIRIFDNLHIIPEVNSSFRVEQDINSSLILRYSYNPRTSIDLYYSNAAGTQDVGQLLENNEYKFGLKFNFLF